MSIRGGRSPRDGYAAPTEGGRRQNGYQRTGRYQDPDHFTLD